MMRRYQKLRSGFAGEFAGRTKRNDSRNASETVSERRSDQRSSQRSYPPLAHRAGNLIAPAIFPWQFRSELFSPIHFIVRAPSVTYPVFYIIEDLPANPAP